MEKKKRPPKFRTNMSVLSLNGTAYAAPSNFPNNGISLAPVYQHAPNILLIEEQLAKAIFPSRSRFLVDSKYIDFPRSYRISESPTRWSLRFQVVGLERGSSFRWKIIIDMRWKG